MKRNTSIFAPAILAALTVGACAPVEGGSNRVDPALAGPPVKVLGDGETCIRTQAIRQSKVRSDQVIDFEMQGGKVYRSTLPNRCPRLGFEEAFSYRTSINQLCKQDIIRVVTPVAGQLDKGPSCGLGEFVPVEYVEEAKTSDE